MDVARVGVRGTFRVARPHLTVAKERERERDRDSHMVGQRSGKLGFLRRGMPPGAILLLGWLPVVLTMNVQALGVVDVQVWHVISQAL